MIGVVILELGCVAAIGFLLCFLWGIHKSKKSRDYFAYLFRIQPLPNSKRPLDFPRTQKSSLGNRQTRRAMMIAVPVLVLSAATAHSQDPESSSSPSVAGSQTGQTQPPAKTPWQYGGFLDAAYLWDPDHPSNQLFRSRGTAYQVNKPMVNMAAVYLKKAASDASRWGMEATLQVGQDTRIFGFSATAPNLPGSKWLRHLGPTSVSYLAPVGKGLTIQGGIFSSLIGYDSLYAKDNLNYTRPWGADFTPYLMLGVNASYPFTAKITGTLFVVNGYWHLADANHVPSSGGQFTYKAADKLTLKQTALYGPHQADTSLEFWRFLYDTIAEWKSDKTTVAFEYHVGTEKIAGVSDTRALWMAAQLPLRRALSNQWTFAIRPEVYWDRDGRMTTFRQTVKALTTTLEYRIPFWQTNAKLRLEHRIDDSRGPQGGFFTDGEISPGVPRLTPTQNLVAFGILWSFDASSERVRK